MTGKVARPARLLKPRRSLLHTSILYGLTTSSLPSCSFVMSIADGFKFVLSFCCVNFGKLYKKMPLIQTLGNRIAKRRWLGLMRMDNDLNASQQIWIKCVRRMRLAGVQSWLLHQSLYPFAINHAPQSTQVLGHPACAIERMPCMLFIKQLQQQTLILIYRFWLPLFIDD